MQKIVELERKYKDKGRLVVRASGTEPRVRVMIEVLTSARWTATSTP